MIPDDPWDGLFRSALLVTVRVRLRYFLYLLLNPLFLGI
jgi:hypothetical protein